MNLRGEVVWLWHLFFYAVLFICLFWWFIYLFIGESFAVEKRCFQAGAGGLQLGKTFTSERMGFALVNATNQLGCVRTVCSHPASFRGCIFSRPDCQIRFSMSLHCFITSN